MRNATAVLLAVIAVIALSIVGASSANAETFEVSTKAKEGKFELKGGITKFVTENGTTIECKEFTASGDLKEGTAIPGNEIGLFLMASWNKGEETCEGPLGLKFAIQANLLPEPWVDLVRQLLNNRDLIDGLVHFHLFHPRNPNCTFLILPGLVPYIDHLRSQLLLWGHAINLLARSAGWGENTLTVSNTSGCLGVIHNGEAVEYEGVAEFTPAGADVLIQ